MAFTPNWPNRYVKLPKEGNMLGRVVTDDWKLGEFFYLPLKRSVQNAILVSGASRAGKRIAACRRRLSSQDVDRVWGFYPPEKLQSISNKTEIIEQIRFSMSHEPEPRFGEESLRGLHEARLNLEDQPRAMMHRRGVDLYLVRASGYLLLGDA